LFFYVNKSVESRSIVNMVGATLFHRRKHSWPTEEFISRSTLQLLDFDSAAPPPHAWRRRLNCHANILKEFTITFREAIKMVNKETSCVYFLRFVVVWGVSLLLIFGITGTLGDTIMVLCQRRGLPWKESTYRSLHQRELQTICIPRCSTRRNGVHSR
jgi:hypothetical protein